MARPRKLWIWLASLVLLVVACGVGIKWQISRISADAKRFAETGKAVITLLNDYKAGIKTFDLNSVMTNYADSYANDRDGFWTQDQVSDRDGVQTYRWHIDTPQRFGKAEQTEQLARYFAGIKAIEESHFKLDRIEDVSDPTAPQIRSVLWLIGQNQDGQTFESQVRFRMWMASTDQGYAIRKQELIDGTTVIGNQKGFADVTEQVGIDFVSKRNPIWSTPEWKPKTFEIVKFASAGVTAADYNNDGWYDIFFADGERPVLYRNDGDGTFTDVTLTAGLPSPLPGVNVAVFADFDNDGDKDLFLGGINTHNRLYRNNGDGTFTDVSDTAGLGGYFVTVGATADYNHDGLLDLYVGRYLDPRTELPTTLFYTRNSEGNSLLRNDGNLRFTDVTAEAGVREGGLTLGAAWGDYDQDGDQDLYVANDFGRNALLRNNGDGTFADVTAASGTLDFGFGMSSSFGDIDNDGDLDIYVSNVHSGQRWYGQATTLYQYLLTSIMQGTIAEDFSLYKEIFTYAGADWRHYGDGMVKGNSLLINNGQGQFTDVSERAGTNPFGWYWTSSIFDYDNDGHQDIYAVNGWVSAKNHEDL